MNSNYKPKYQVGEYVKFKYRNACNKRVVGLGNVEGCKNRFYIIKNSYGIKYRIYCNQVFKVQIPNKYEILPTKTQRMEEKYNRLEDKLSDICDMLYAIRWRLLFGIGIILLAIAFCK